MPVEAFKDEIHKTFVSYVRHATEVLQQRRSLKEKMVDPSPKLAYIDRGFRLRYLVEVAENSPQFKDLCSVEGGDERRRAFQNFFRRSRFYIRAFNREQLFPDELFGGFWSGLFQRKVKTTTMRILAGVEFASPVIDCGAFKIQKFTKDELHRLTEKEVNEVFYDFARIDTDILSQYWLLVEEHSGNRGVNNVATDPSTNQPDFDFDELLSVKLETPDRAVQLLAIHDWTPDYTEEELKEMQVGLEAIKEGWPGITVPNRFEFSDDVFSEPMHRAELQVGSPDPFYYAPIAIGVRQQTRIKTIVEKGSKLLKIVERAKPHWDFVSVAMGYRGKAFLTEPSPEQLLWNIAVVDCLLSEKDEVTQSMKRRIGNILGETEQERKTLRKDFEELYDFRSHLVHGKTFSKKIRDHHLLKARELASRIFAWFMDYLLWVDEDFHQRDIGYEHYPRREELLCVLDFDRASLNRLNRFIGRLPTSFPKF